jgi:hypothetical protein
VGDVTFPFSLRGKVGHVRVTLSPNDDPARVGCELLDPSIPADAARGFPMCEATPVIDLDGYAGTCGWIQLVRSSDASGEFELDPLSLFRGVETPFAFFGVRPTLFDAPFRADRYDLTWTARSFLCAVPDAVMSKVVEPVLGFEWGFTVEADAITIVSPSPLQLAAWDEHLPLFQATFPNWTFATANA